MKIKKLLILICSVFLTGCYSEMVLELETIPVDKTSPVKVQEISETIHNNTEDISSTYNDIQGAPVYITNEVTTGYAAHATDPVISVDRNLITRDENYYLETAYLSGNYSGLSEKDGELLMAVKNILEPLKGKSSYAIAAGVHDSLVENVSYGFGENQYTAYGALVDGVAVCQGYAYAYKLCMDLAGIDCITVGGIADNGEETTSHAWNMVKLGDKWYHVDVTWDDSITESELGVWNHTYLFVNDELINNDHKAETVVQGIRGMNKLPVAEDAEHFYLKLEGMWVNDSELFENLIVSKIEAGEKTVEIACEGFIPDLQFISCYASCSYIEHRLGDVTFLYIMMN